MGTNDLRCFIGIHFSFRKFPGILKLQCDTECVLLSKYSKFHRVPAAMDEEESFSARIENVKIVSDVLECLCQNQRSKDHPCYIEVTSSSLAFTVTGKAKSTQARCNLDAELFEEYMCSSASSIIFAINLSTLIDCFTIFSAYDNTEATFDYCADDALFKVSLVGVQVLTTCEIQTLHFDSYDDLNVDLVSIFRTADEECQIIVKSEPLRDAVMELVEVVGAHSVEISVNEALNVLKFSTVGTVSACDIEFTKGNDLFVSFRCENPISFSYRLDALTLGMKALVVAKETYLRINKDGVACIQHQVETAKGPETYIDFLMIPIDTV